MKRLFLVTAILFGFAQTAQSASSESVNFVCQGAYGKTKLSIEANAGEYADWIRVYDLDKDTKQFLEGDELALKTSGETLVIAATNGSCTKGIEENEVLSCSLNKEKSGWADSEYAFNFSRKIKNTDWIETLKVTRPVSINKMDLKVLNEDGNAILVLNMNADLAHEKNKNIKIVKFLGAINGGSARCKFLK